MWTVSILCAVLQLKPIPQYAGDPLPQFSSFPLTSNSGLLLDFLLSKKEIRYPAATADRQERRWKKKTDIKFNHHITTISFFHTPTNSIDHHPHGLRSKDCEK